LTIGNIHWVSIIVIKTTLEKSFPRVQMTNIFHEVEAGFYLNCASRRGLIYTEDQGGVWHIKKRSSYAERFPNARPHHGHLPAFMQTIQPYTDWNSGNVGISTVNGSFMQSGKGAPII